METENGALTAATTTTTAVTSPPPMASSPRQALVERLKDYGQEDIFSLWDELSPDEKDFLVRDIEVCVFDFAFFFPNSSLRFGSQIQSKCNFYFFVYRIWIFQE